MIILLGGVSGVGKTAVGQSLAERLGCDFRDADDLHPAENIEKMRLGTPLTDDDRRDWLAAVRQVIDSYSGKPRDLVFACSALKPRYREFLSTDRNVLILILEADIETVRGRIAGREDHFMSPELLESQFGTLELTGDDILVDASAGIGETVNAIVKLLTERPLGSLKTL